MNALVLDLLSFDTYKGCQESVFLQCNKHSALQLCLIKHKITAFIKLASSLVLSDSTKKDVLCRSKWIDEFVILTPA